MVSSRSCVASDLIDIPRTSLSDPINDIITAIEVKHIIIIQNNASLIVDALAAIL